MAKEIQLHTECFNIQSPDCIRNDLRKEHFNKPQCKIRSNANQTSNLDLTCCFGLN